MPDGAHTLNVALQPWDAERIDVGPVLALDPDAWSACRAKGLETIGPGDLHGYRREQSACASSLLEAFHACSDGGADRLHPLKVVFYRHVRWIHRVASVAAAVSCAVRDRDMQAIITLGPSSGHAMDRPANDARMPVLIGAAAAGACHGGASHESRGCESARPEPRPQTPIQTLSSVPKVGPLGDHVLVIADGPDLARLLPLREQIEDAAGASVVYVSHEHSPEPPVFSVQSYAGPASGDGRDEPAARRAFLDQSVCAGGLAQKVAHCPEFSSHLEFVFEDYARSISKNVARWETSLRSRAPKAVIGSYHSVGLEVAGHLGIPSLMLPHGPMLLGADEYTRSVGRGVVVGAVGAAHARRSRDVLGPEHPIVETGVVGESDRMPIDTTAGRPPRLLIPTSETTRPAHLGEPPVSLFDQEAAAIGQLVEGLAARGWLITIRNHPRYDRGEAFYREATRGAPAKAVTVTSAADSSLEDALRRSDAVAFTSSPSSAMLEIARTGVPMLLITQSWAHRALEQWGLTELPQEPTSERAIERLAPLAETGGFSSSVRRSLDAGAASAGLLADRPTERTMEAIRSATRG
ncbi:MAG: hypothetical protein AAGG07_12190 [Planctomycetota bacterium]